MTHGQQTPGDRVGEPRAKYGLVDVYVKLASHFAYYTLQVNVGLALQLVHMQLVVSYGLGALFGLL
jgi:hypothetical protein